MTISHLLVAKTTTSGHQGAQVCVIWMIPFPIAGPLVRPDNEPTATYALSMQLGRQCVEVGIILWHIFAALGVLFSRCGRENGRCFLQLPDRGQASTEGPRTLFGSNSGTGVAADDNVLHHWFPQIF